MSTASKSATLSNEVIVGLQDALAKMMLLKKELVTASSKSTNNALELEAKHKELNSIELNLQADRAEFEAQQKLWEATKGREGSSNVTGQYLKDMKAKLDMERVELEDEKSQIRLTQIQLKGAQSRLEDAISKFEAAKIELEEARSELEIARAHLEAAQTQTGINNMRLKAAKESLEASKMKFEAATNELKEAKSYYEDAKTQLDVVTASIKEGKGTSTSCMEKENNELRLQVKKMEDSEHKLKAKNQQLEKEVSNLNAEVAQQKVDKLKLEADLKECKEEKQLLDTEHSELKNNKEKVDNELKESRSELEKIKEDYKSLNAQVVLQKDYKLKSEAELKECRAENSELKNNKERVDNELQESRGELERVKKENKSLTEGVGAEVEQLKTNNKQLQEEFVKLRGVNKGNPTVFFDIDIRGVRAGRIVMELYADTSPRIAEVFRSLCTGTKVLPGTGRLVGYKSTEIANVYPEYYIYGGNVRVENKAELESIYGSITPAEISSGKRTGQGDLLLVSWYLDNRKSSTFLINTCNELYKFYAIIGRVIQGMDLVNSINTGFPHSWLVEGSVVIADCGQLN